ncbi:unnamed protein product [Urochloa humidicola]
MLRSPSSLRSLLHHSGRLLRPRIPRFPGSPNPPLPSYPRFPRSRFLSSSSSPTPGGAQWATNDHDSLINSLCASASDTPADADSDVWAVFDPVAGRIVIQRPPPSSSTAEDEMEGEGAGKRREGEEKAGVKEKGKGRRKGRACASGEKGQTGRWSVAAARKPAGKGGKEKVSYECSLCGEAHSQWWRICRYCNAPGTIQEGAGERDQREGPDQPAVGRGGAEVNRVARHGSGTCAATAGRAIRGGGDVAATAMRSGPFRAGGRVRWCR